MDRIDYYYFRMYRYCQIIVLLGLFALPLAAQQRIEADFVQTRTMAVLSEPIVQRGHFRYLYPDSVSWIYEGQTALSMPQQMASLINRIATGDTTALQTAFRIEKEGNEWRLYPIKKQMSRLFSSLQIRLGDLGAAEQVIMTEPTGDETRIDFNHIQVQ